MADVFSKVKRSLVMATIRSSGNQGTELVLARLFRTHRVTGWRRKQRILGKPDFVFLHQRVAVFVDGCFWHGCQWHCRMPKSRGHYWGPKIARNRSRDREVARKLGRQGWYVLRIWEHSLKKPASILRRLQAVLASRSQTRYIPLCDNRPLSTRSPR